MKKLLLLGFLAFSWSCRMSLPRQEQSPSLNGLGTFKIHQTTVAIIPELEKELKVRLKPVQGENTSAQNVPREFPFTPVKQTPASSRAELRKVRVFHLPTYQMGDLSLQDVYLTFQNRLLIQVKCASTPELREAMTLRYGSPKSTTTTNSLVCISQTTKAVAKNQESTVTDVWRSGKADSLEAISTQRQYYDRACMAQSLATFIISTPAEREQVSHWEKELAARRKPELVVPKN